MGSDGYYALIICVTLLIPITLVAVLIYKYRRRSAAENNINFKEKVETEKQILECEKGKGKLESELNDEIKDPKEVFLKTSEESKDCRERHCNDTCKQQ